MVEKDISEIKIIYDVKEEKIINSRDFSTGIQRQGAVLVLEKDGQYIIIKKGEAAKENNITNSS